MSRAVLIVEDDEAIRTSLAEFLEGTGFIVHSAGHGADALDLLKTIDPPAVIVLDLMMPVMNGSEFLEAMRKDTRLARHSCGDFLCLDSRMDRPVNWRGSCARQAGRHDAPVGPRDPLLLRGSGEAVTCCSVMR